MVSLKLQKFNYYKLSTYLRNRKHIPCFSRVIDSDTSRNLGEREMLWEH